MIDPGDHARVIEERNELGRQNDRYEKALRTVFDMKCSAERASAGGRCACCHWADGIIEAALTGSAAK